MQTFEQMRTERIRKLNELIKLGKNPYGSYPGGNTPIATAREQMDKDVEVAGRILSVRGHGKLIFADLYDETGKIQLMFKQDIMNEHFKMVDLYDVGDFIKAKGKVTTTVKGEISVLVTETDILTKSIRPLPEKWHGLKDVEERYRQRYVDLLVNENVKSIFLTRSKIIKLLRAYLDKNGFTEVETPVLQPLYGGASANPFITHHKALDIDLYLRISDELYLKRLVVGGFDKVYELSKDFRNEGMSKAHNPEFTMLEFYWAYVDYEHLMRFTEEMISSIVKEIKGSCKVTFKDKEYDFSTPWKRIPFLDLFKEYLGMDISSFKDEKELLNYVTEHKLLAGNEAFGFRDIIDVVYKKHIRPKLEGPLFLTDYPYAMKPLAKRRPDNPEISASFQLLVGGEEFINAYNELNDPMDQRKRWEDEMELGKKGAEDYQVIDDDYIRALEYGMPPTAGWGLGIDRLTAFLTNQHTIKDVILFPTMRPEHSAIQQSSDAAAKKTSTKKILTITRDLAFKLVDDNIKNKNLVKHCLSVEATMRALARHFGQDEDLWGIVGLLHDADWEVTQPDAALHTKKTMEWLDIHGENDVELRDAILAHNHENNGARAPESLLEWALFTCDELTGIVTASALVRPDKKLGSVEVKSVLKKFNTPSFAAAVNRDQIRLCEDKLGIPLEQFVEITLKAMQGISDELGL